KCELGILFDRLVVELDRLTRVGEFPAGSRNALAEELVRFQEEVVGFGILRVDHARSILGERWRNERRREHHTEDDQPGSFHGQTSAWTADSVPIELRASLSRSCSYTP